LEDLKDADELISTRSAIRHFIFTLGYDFESIQNNYPLGNLPTAWNTEDWPTILILCRDFYNSIHPQGPPKKDNQLQESSFSNPQERAAHHKKIRQWFLNPSKCCTEIEGEQKKHPGQCIYHVSKLQCQKRMRETTC